MIKIIKELNVEVTKPNIFQAIVAKQYDMNTRFLKVAFMDCGTRIDIPNTPTLSVVINAERKDGQSKGFDGVINDDGTVTVPLHSWMLELEGTVICDISVIDSTAEDNKKLTTTSFTLIVEKAAYGGNDVTNDPQYDVLVELIERVERIEKGSADQTYNPESEIAQSGYAVAEASENVKSYANTTFANAIKNSISGNIVIIPDISPIEHNLDVKLTSENLLDISKITNTALISVDVQNNTIILAEDDNQKYTNETLSELCPQFKVGDKVVFSYKSDGWVYVNGDFAEEEKDGIRYLYFTIDENHLAGSLSFPSSTTLVSGISIKTNDFSNIEVISSGKNLFNINAISSGDGFVNNGDDTITVSKFSVNTMVTLQQLCPALRVGDTIRFSMETDYSATEFTKKWLYLYSSDEYIRATEPYTIKEGDLESLVGLYGHRVDGVMYPITFSNMQIELGTEVTEYEPYQEPQIAKAEADGTVKRLKSCYPTTILKTDTESVIINATYNVDTKKYLDSKSSGSDKPIDQMAVEEVLRQTANAIRGTTEYEKNLVITDLSPIKHIIAVECDFPVTRRGKNFYSGGDLPLTAFATVVTDTFLPIIKSLPLDTPLYFSWKYSSNASGGTENRIVLMNSNTNVLQILHNRTEPVILTQDDIDKINKVVIYGGSSVPEGETRTGSYSNIQIELGSEKTTYEPYVEPKVFEAEEGIAYIPSLYPTTVLLGGNNITIKATYNKDTNIILDIAAGKQKWKGKKWCVVGDSITDKTIRTTKSYHDYVAENTGISVVNMGLSETGYMEKYEEGNAFYQRILNIPQDTDVVTIFGSTNDLGWAKNRLGTARDNLDTEGDTELYTVLGCVNKTLDNLFATLPLARVGIVTPLPSKNANEFKSNTGEPISHEVCANYVNGLIEICKLRSIPCLDLYHNSNLRPWDADFRELAYNKDVQDGDYYGLHPNETGHAILAPKFKAFLETLIL